MRAFVEPVNVGENLTAKPLFLVPPAFVELPLEATCEAVFREMPARWRQVLAV